MVLREYCSSLAVQIEIKSSKIKNNSTYLIMYNYVIFITYTGIFRCINFNLVQTYSMTSFVLLFWRKNCLLNPKLIWTRWSGYLQMNFVKTLTLRKYIFEAWNTIYMVTRRAARRIWKKKRNVIEILPTFLSIITCAYINVICYSFVVGLTPPILL